MGFYFSGAKNGGSRVVLENDRRRCDHPERGGCVCTLKMPTQGIIIPHDSLLTISLLVFGNSNVKTRDYHIDSRLSCKTDFDQRFHG